jgi:hypothetical protein
MQDVHLKLNPGFPWPMQHSAWGRIFLQQIVLEFEEDNSEIVHLSIDLCGI